MCTVLFIPGKKQHFFVSLRDENPNRMAASSPFIWENNPIHFMAPKDEQAGGTWAGINSLGTAIILLNGAFQNHEKACHYATSRGLIVTSLLAAAQPITDYLKMNLQNIEPFTLIIFHNNLLYQLVWDGENKFPIQLNAHQPYIFSSSTLYTLNAKEVRENLFNNWIKKNPPISPESIFAFFKSFPDKHNGFIINRNEEIKTLSYTFIELLHDKRAVIHYTNLKNNDNKTLSLPINTQVL